jgi:hypothetical protein
MADNSNTVTSTGTLLPLTGSGNIPTLVNQSVTVTANQTPIEPTNATTLETLIPTSTSATATPPSPPTHSIRNIMQTVQEREIIKTCPDIIVYLDGKTYLINPYINDTKSNPSNPTPFSYVSFNDHVQTFQASYDVDNLIPSGSITLQVPNHLKYLYQSPGGNNLIESMMEVQVFAKGYFPSGTGNTVYHRVFKGLTTNINHSDSGMVLQISIQCMGILHFLEYMYTDLNPAALSNSDRGQTPMGSNQYDMNPYQQLADVFNRGITMDGFMKTSILQASLNKQAVGTKDEDQWRSAIEAGYVNKWNTILDNLRREVHITGYKMGVNTLSDKDLPVPDSADTGATKKVAEVQATHDPTLQASKFIVNSAASAINTSNADYYVSAIKKYQPDLSIGSLQLVNGRITGLLERIRTIVQMINYEGYQDVDGTVIFKPPLYNLDVTNIGSTVVTSNKNKIPTSADIREDTNPFVVHLSEIDAESEVEDEQGIRATRITAQTPFLTNSLISNDATSMIRPAVTHVDIPKLAKFGLREEQARTIPWLIAGDKVAAYTYAVGELTRANRSWRSYTLTIPLRPELKLGFPMYLPHKDMYGYIKNINISYQQGGAATMSILLDSLRKRPVFPAQHKVESKTGSQDVTIYTTQPNLVMQWTKAPDPATTTSTAANTTSTASTNPTTSTQGNSKKSSKPPAKTADGTIPAGTKAVQEGSSATITVPQTQPVYQEDLEVIGNRQHQWGTSWQTKADTKTKSFRVQKDVATSADENIKDSKGVSHKTGITSGTPFFSKDYWINPRPLFDVNGNPVYVQGTNGQKNSTNQATSAGVNIFYLQKILTSQPYTDEGGYELLTPFPWGRWISLKEALLETRLGITSTEVVNSLDTQTLAGTQVFLFAGVSSPQAIDPSSNLSDELTKLNDISSFVASATSFELITPPPGISQDTSLSDTQPDKQVEASISDEDKAAFFLTGSNDSSSNITQLYRTVTPPTNTSILPNALGVTPSANQQSQTFISKLLNGNKTTQ